MRTIKTILAAFAAFSLTVLAQRASEAVTTGSVTNITRLVSVVPQYSDDSSVTLLSITETTKKLVVLPGGKLAEQSTESRQWTLDAINALPVPWTNQAGVVVTNNAYKNQLLNLWTRLDNHPESVTLRVKQPGITWVAPPPPPVTE